MYIVMGSLSVYGTAIRGCGLVDTIYRVVNSGSSKLNLWLHSIAFFFSTNR